MRLGALRGNGALWPLISCKATWAHAGFRRVCMERIKQP